MNEAVQGGHRLTDGGVGIGPMTLVEVDIVGVEPSQAGLEGHTRYLRPSPVVLGPSPMGPKPLGGEHHLITPDLDGSSDDFLGFAAHVHVCPCR